MTYTYPKVSGGYRWNMLRRCIMQVGIEPTGSSDVGDQTVLTFDRDLTEEEKANLDALMIDNPTYPPSWGVSMEVADPFEDLAAFRVQTGQPELEVFYKSSDNSSKIDRLVFWIPSTPTNQQKNAIKTAYTNLYKG